MSPLKKLIRTDLLKNFKPYSSAASEMGKIEGAAYLNANENPYPFSGLEGYERYDVQQPPALIQSMAKAYHTKPEYVIATRGSDESIDLLIRIFCESGKDAILTCPPTFGMYGVYGTLQGAQNITIPLIEKNGTFILDEDTIISSAKDPQKNIKLVFLCYPNSPTGNLFEESILEKILTSLCEHAAVVIDEAYINFTDRPSFIEKLEHHPNLLVLRTLSKVHALAGERVGGTICADIEFMTYMRGCLAPYPIAKSVTAHAVEALKQAQGKQDEMVARIVEQRKILVDAFSKSQKVEHVYPSETNFLLVKFKTFEDAQAVFKKALAASIILRDVSSKLDTRNCLRISVGSPDDNKKLRDLLT